MEIATIGIDLGKTVFHLVGHNKTGETVVRNRFSRAQLLRFTANLKMGLIGMEACAGSHFLGRAWHGVIGQRRDLSANVDDKQYGGGCVAGTCGFGDIESKPNMGSSGRRA